jgi:hypothetical protein
MIEDTQNDRLAWATPKVSRLAAGSAEDGPSQNPDGTAFPS